MADLDKQKLQQVSDGFNQNTGSQWLQNSYGSARDALIQAMKNKMQKTDTTMPDTVGDGS